MALGETPQPGLSGKWRGRRALPRHAKHLDQQVWLCTEASAIHEAETTRRQDPLQSGNSADQLLQTAPSDS